MKIRLLTKGLSLAGFVLFPLLFISPLAQADDAAIELINRMNRALHELTYKGSLAYLRGDSLSTLHIEHNVVNGVESERVVRLNEAGNEVSRELTGFSLSSIPQIVPEMNKVYSFDMGRMNRIANRKCRIITARPKDRNRYLQKYCIDDVTGMLLDYMLVGKSHKPVEQLMFTTIEIALPESDSVVEEQVGQADNSISNVTNTVLDNTMTSVVDTSNASMAKKTLIEPIATVLEKARFKQVSNIDLDDGWVMEKLPAGFAIRSAPSSNKAQETEEVTKHYIVSDGLSSLSVFVSPLTDGVVNTAVKINSGALNVVSQEKDGHLVTVVGEVPETTLKNIVKSLQKK
ncbi:MAG: MucB/RseB C-terminal domain-containing protein [Cocleimonas sp.]